MIFDIPASICVARATSRTSHEGGVHGTMARGIVNRMKRQLEVEGGYPLKSEGLQSILVSPAAFETLEVMFEHADNTGVDSKLKLANKKNLRK